MKISIYLGLSLFGLWCTGMGVFKLAALFSFSCANLLILRLAGKKLLRRAVYFYPLIFVNVLPLIYLKIIKSSTDKVFLIGFTFFILQMIAVLVDLRRSPVSTPINFRLYLIYLFYFPKFFIGPIEKYATFCRKISEPHPGIAFVAMPSAYLVVVGIFKSFILAPEAAELTNRLFFDIPPGDSASAACMIYLSAIQLYCEFSGYTDIARGTSKLLGIDLELNFRFPFLAVTPQEYWQRWHISLTNWIRDYLFYPLASATKNLYFSMLCSVFAIGFLHGITWNSVMWGGLASLSIVVSAFMTGPLYQLAKEAFWIHRSMRLIFWFFTQNFFCFGIFLLISPNFKVVLEALRALAQPGFGPLAWQLVPRIIFLISPLVIIESVFFLSGGIEERLKKKELLLSALVVAYFSFSIIYFNSSAGTRRVEFLYFQF